MSEDSPVAADVIERLDELEARLDPEADLEPMSPEAAREEWLARLDDRSDSTIRSYRDRTVHFLRFCAAYDIENLNDLATRHMKAYESERISDGLDVSTRKNEWGTLQRFLEYCEDLDAVASDVPDALDVPSPTKEERINTEKLPIERAETILENLKRYRYATREHVTFLLFWRTTMRLGALHSLDVQDVYLEDDDLERLRRTYEEEGYAPSVVEKMLERAETPFVFPRNRPETGTRLKNGVEGERVINLASEVGEIVANYLRVTRADVEDEHGRSPLLSSQKGDGRLSKSAIRNWMYVLTQPCEFGGECPHDRDPETCEAREHGYGNKCPSARSPHKIRTGSFTWHRDRGWPRRDLEAKANTTEIDVYDQPEHLTRAAGRRDLLDRLDEDDE
ncbi:tyrosine-type recombinase/integrase [Halarchaeum nitratireducens]|uniref:Integrase n=1 Tax=Halarchaeum nitratireducens TaxID=489913 RepID=A0A830G895_9EURY|nr:site-specific integrase [Halarchaeum nitratireducens]GGN08118.1 integrase [Halarchaeum nitratireducens]